MKAAQYQDFRQPIEIVNLPEPDLPRDGVIIKVQAAGLCRSDWHGWMGHDADIQPPQVPGHELAGTVEAVGPQVKRWRVGNRVTVPFCLGCGHCPQCRRGDQQVCDYYYQPGFTGPGAFAQYVALPYADVNLVALPEMMSFEDAAVLGCRFITAYRALIAQGRTQPGDWVAIHGCGGVGLSAILVAHGIGARVIAVDIRQEALAAAKKAGANILMNAQEIPDIPDAIRSVTRGGVQVSMDALGNSATCVNSVLSLAKRGRHLQVGLLTGPHSTPAIPMGPVIANELEILGSHGMQAHAYPGMLRWIESGRLQPQRLLGNTISLEELPEALMQMDRQPPTGVTVVNRF